MNALRAGLLLGLSLVPAAAHAAAGQVLFALGRVEIDRGGQPLVAQRGTPVEVGDTIRTGPTGLAQVRLKDGSLLSLRYGSTMKVEEFSLPAPAPAPAPQPAAAPAATAPPAATGGRSVLRLLRGAFRTVTGLIGKGANDAYQVITPVATIGIRGTDYSAAYCNADCGTTPDGLYVGVSSGQIELNNGAGELVLSNDQYGYVKDNATPPDRELAPPEALEAPIAPPEESEEADERGDAETGDAGAAPESGYSEESGARDAPATGDTQPEADYELRPGIPGSYAFASPGAKAAGSNGVYTDDSGALIGVLTNRFVTIGTARNVETGSDAATGLRWGRWTGGTASVGGSALDLRAQSLHWIYAEASSTARLRTTGTASYSLVGGTNPTDTAGNVGFLGAATLTADFDNQQVTSTLNIGMPSEVWVASGSGSIATGTPLFSGSYAVNVNDAAGAPISTGTGVFNGFFTDGALGAGLGYYLSSGGEIITGAAAFAEAQPGVQ
jgi:hypothetical protein